MFDIKILFADDSHLRLSVQSRLKAELRLSASSTSDGDKDETPSLPPKNATHQVSDIASGSIPVKPPRYRSTGMDYSSESYLSLSLTDSSHAGPLDFSPVLPKKTVSRRYNNSAEKKANINTANDLNRKSSLEKRRSSLPQFIAGSVSSDENGTKKYDTQV